MTGDAAMTPTIKYNTLKDQRYAARKRRETVEELGLRDRACDRCGATVRPLDQVCRVRSGTFRHDKDGKSRRRQQWEASPFCPACRVSGRATRRQAKPRRGWDKTDYMKDAETELFPDVPYAKMTPLMRRQSYFLARVRWLARYGDRLLPGTENGASAMEKEITRLRALQAQLRRDGCVVEFPPFTDCLHGDDYADAGRLDAGAAEERGAADFDRDAEGAQAEDFYALVAGIEGGVWLGH